MKHTADTITDAQILAAARLGFIGPQGAQLALEADADLTRYYRDRHYYRDLAASALNALPLTADTVTDMQITRLAADHGATWIEAGGRNLRLSWHTFEALHSHRDVIKQRARGVCADFINKLAEEML